MTFLVNSVGSRYIYMYHSVIINTWIGHTSLSVLMEDKETREKPIGSDYPLRTESVDRVQTARGPHL